MGFVKTYEEILGNQRQSADFHDAEMLTVVWETTPEAVAKLLPPPLKPVEKPIVVAFVANYPSTNFGVPYLESALLVRASFEGQTGNYCLAMPVTNDIAMAGGREIYGYPKKMANIALNREGDTVEGWTERHGIRFMKIRANLTGRINDNSAMNELISYGFNPDGEFSSIAFNFKHFPSPVAGESFDYPPRLVQGEVVFRPRTFIFAEAEIELAPSEYDPWHDLPVVRMLGGIYSVGDNSMLKGTVVAEADPIAFAPYAFLKWEWAKSHIATGDKKVIDEKQVDERRQVNFSVDSTTVGELLDNPISREFMDRVMPELVNHPAISMIRQMTLRAVGPLSGGKLTEDVLAMVDAELKKL